MEPTTEAASNSLVSADPFTGSVETSSFLDKNVVNDTNVLNGSDSFSSVSDDGFVSGEEDFDVEKKVFLDYPDDNFVEFKTVDVNSGDPFVDFETPIAGGEGKSYKDVVLESGEGLNLGEGLNGVVEGNVDVIKKSYKDVVVESGEGLNGVVEGNSDVVEKSFKDVVVEGGEGLRSGENGVVEGNGDVVEKSCTDVVVESGEGLNGVVEGNGDVVEKSFKDVVVESGEGLSGNADFVTEGGFEENKVSEFSEGLGNGVEEIKLESEEVLEVKKMEGVSQVVEKHVVESSESEQVGDVIVESGDGVEVTHEEDAVVETINVDLLEPGVAVVGEMEGNGRADRSTSLNVKSDQVSAGTVEEGSGENIVVSSDSKNLSLDNESDKVIVGTDEESSVQNIITPSKSELSELDGAKVIPDVDSVEEVEGVVSSNNEADQDHGEILLAVQDEPNNSADVKTTPEGDSVIENIQVDMSEPGVAVVGKIEENGQADAYVGNIQENEKEFVIQVEGNAEASAKLENPAEEVEVFTRNLVAADDFDAVVDAPHSTGSFPTNAGEQKQNDDFSANIQDKIIENGVSEKSSSNDSAESNQLRNKELEVKDEINFGKNEASEGDLEGSGSEASDSDDMIFGSSEAAKQFIEELERGSEGNSNSGAESFHDNAQRIDGQIVTDSEEEDTDEEGEGKELFDSAALTALLKAATGAGSDGGKITFTSPDGSGLFSIERPVGLGSSTQFLRPAPRANRSNFLTPSSFAGGEESENNLSAEEKEKLEKLQSVRVKFLRLVQRLGMSSDDPIASRVLYRLALVAGRQTGQLFSLDSAKETALQLEEDEKEDLDFSLNILVLGKSGVGKSATINAIFGEEKARVDAFQHATTTVKEIIGVVDGVKIRVFDTPGLKSSVLEQSFNQSILSSVKKFTKKNPVDIVLYVDRLDAQTRDLNDVPLLSTITSSLGTPIWRSVIVTLTHAASAPPEGPSGSPLSYDSFVTQRSHIVQQSIGRASGDLRMMSPGLMNPVCLVENHGSCRRNREGQKILPNGQSWRPQLMILCYSTKILSEANSISEPQDLFDSRKLFAYRTRPAPLAYMLSSMLQSRVHPKLSSEQGGDNGDSDVDLADLSDSDQEDEDEYDQLPPFKPLRKSQLAKLSVEQRKAYFEEYDYRVKLLQKKQWREELKRLKEMKMKGKDSANDHGYSEEDPDAGSPAPVSVPLPDMALPPSFDGDNPAHRYRFLEPTSQFLARPVLDTHGWDHDCGYDGVNLEQSLAILSQFPAVVSVQLTKDKKEFTVNLDSSIAAKHGENGSSMAGFDIQNMGKQLAYIIRGETKFKNFRKNKTAAGISVTFLGENVVSGLKVEDQISFGKQYSLVASGGTVRSQQEVAYGANIEMQRRELDYPIGQVQSSLGLSLIKFRGELAMGFNSLAQFSIGRNSKVTVRGAINNKLSGQISVRTSSSEHLSLALASILPVAVTIYKKLCPVGEKYSIY